jgi:hypothetical protein
MDCHAAGVTTAAARGPQGSPTRGVLYNYDSTLFSPRVPILTPAFRQICDKPSVPLAVAVRSARPALAPPEAAGPALGLIPGAEVPVAGKGGTHSAFWRPSRAARSRRPASSGHGDPDSAAGRHDEGVPCTPWSDGGQAASPTGAGRPMYTRVYTPRPRDDRRPDRCSDAMGYPSYQTKRHRCTRAGRGA